MKSRKQKAGIVTAEDRITRKGRRGKSSNVFVSAVPQLRPVAAPVGSGQLRCTAHRLNRPNQRPENLPSYRAAPARLWMRPGSAPLWIGQLSGIEGPPKRVSDAKAFISNGLGS